MCDKTNPTNIRLGHHSRPHPYHRVDGDQGNQRQRSGLITVTEIGFYCAESTRRVSHTKAEHQSYKPTNSDDLLLRVKGVMIGRP